VTIKEFLLNSGMSNLV